MEPFAQFDWVGGRPNELPRKRSVAVAQSGQGEEAMFATRTSPRVILLVLVICLISSAPSFPQSADLLNTSKMSSNRMSSSAWMAKCVTSSVSSLAAWRFADGIEPPPQPINEVSGGPSISNLLLGVCLDSTLAVRPRALADNPCRQNVVGIAGISRTFPCSETEDTIPSELAALGKAGVKIARAREEVLDILRSQNACTEWFETKEPSAAATFQSLSFLLDRRGPQDIFESTSEGSIVIRRQPYVARATQDGGAHTAITINANGAFYKPQGQVLKIGRETGPALSEGTRLLTVGTYMGDTLPAQMVTLLHEFGHVIDLLPEDADDLDGKSVKNTDEVLRHCRSEIESRAQQAKQTAKRWFAAFP
jgi:hypothetical protein